MSGVFSENTFLTTQSQKSSHDICSDLNKYLVSCETMIVEILVVFDFSHLIPLINFFNQIIERHFAVAFDITI